MLFGKVKNYYLHLRSSLNLREFLLYHGLAALLVMVNLGNIAYGVVRYQEGAVLPLTTFHNTRINKLPPIQWLFCSQKPISLLGPGDGLGPVLALSHGLKDQWTTFDNRNAQDIVSIDFGKKVNDPNQSCVNYMMPEWEFDGDVESSWEFSGNATDPLTGGTIVAFDPNEVDGGRLTTQIPLNAFSYVQIRATQYIFLNGSISYKYDLTTGVSQMFSLAEIPLNYTSEQWGTAFFSFAITLFDRNVDRDMQTVTEIRSYTYVDFLTAIVTCFNITVMIFFCCFPRQYLVASTPSFVLNPKLVFDPYQLRMIQHHMFRLPRSSTSNRTSSIDQSKKPEGALEEMQLTNPSALSLSNPGHPQMDLEASGSMTPQTEQV